MNYPSPMAQIVTINPLLHTFTVSSQRPKFVLISTTYIWVCLITANTLHQTKVAEERRNCERRLHQAKLHIAPFTGRGWHHENFE